MTIELLPLYKRTKTDAIQVCKISVDGDTYTVEFGQLDGKMQTKDTKCFPKNVGRANETSAHEQALSEAQSKWKKKNKAGYSPNKEAPINVQLPQRVKPYIGNEDKIKFPAYSVMKLNGVNGIYWKHPDGTLSLTSRGGDEYPAIPHLEETILAAMDKLGTDCLNGELYIHGEHLQDITSAVKKPKELSKKLDFRVFELPNINKPFSEKVELLKDLDIGLTPVKVNNIEELENDYKTTMGLGYEGTVIYNADAVYKFNERSSSVYKYKKTIDGEFKVKGHSLDKNGHPVYICESDGGDFKAKRKGTAEERLADAVIATSNYGKWLTVEYETLSKDGKPLKPIATVFRACDVQGNPIE